MKHAFAGFRKPPRAARGGAGGSISLAARRRAPDISRRAARCRAKAGRPAISIRERRNAPACERVPVSDTRSAVMAAAAVGYLLALGAILPHPGFSVEASAQIMAAPAAPWTFAGLWAAIALEALWPLRKGRRAAPGAAARALLVCLIPPCRVSVCPEAPGTMVWIPGGGWRERSESLFDELERRAALPMLWAALLVVPVVAVEFLLHDRAAEHPRLALGLHFVNALIWSCFALEFAAMLPLAPRKKQYCARHWLSIVIILLPGLGFLRALRLFSALGAAGSMQFLRAWRFRVLAARAPRGAVLQHRRALDAPAARNVLARPAPAPEEESGGTEKAGRGDPPDGGARGAAPRAGAAACPPVGGAIRRACACAPKRAEWICRARKRRRTGTLCERGVDPCRG